MPDERLPSRHRVLHILATERRKTQPQMAAVPNPIPEDEGKTPPPIDTNEMFEVLWGQRHNGEEIDRLKRDIAGVDKVVDELLRQAIVFEELTPMFRATAKHVDILAEARTREVARNDALQVEFVRAVKLIEKIDGRLDTIGNRMVVHDEVQAELRRNDAEQGKQLAKVEQLELGLANVLEDKKIEEALRAQREKSAARWNAMLGLLVTLVSGIIAVIVAHYIH